MSTWILLRGLTRETRHWGRFPAILHDAVKTDSLLQLDLPGNGALIDQRAPGEVGAMVRFVRQAVMQSSVPGPYQVLAMSLGGMVATAWAQQYPAEIERLVLINTSMRPFSRMTERSASAGVAGAAAGGGGLAERPRRRDDHPPTDLQPFRGAGERSRRMDRDPRECAGEPGQRTAPTLGSGAFQCRRDGATLRHLDPVVGA